MNIFGETWSIFTMRNWVITVVFTALTVVIGSAQLPRVFNASFEGEPRDATIPRGWHKCEDGTTPDILPGPWGVYLEPMDGSSYVGLITRDNGTFESIGQKISAKLEKGNCYFLSLYLARSDTYMGYDRAVKLRIWGGSSKCSRDMLIAETELIEHTEWRKYTFDFTPDRNLRYLIIEAFYSEEPFEHAGNILIDGLSDIQPCGKT